MRPHTITGLHRSLDTQGAYTAALPKTLPRWQCLATDASRPQRRARCRNVSHTTMKPGIDRQDRFDGIEMLHEHPQARVRRSWNDACNSRQSVFEPIQPSFSFLVSGCCKDGTALPLTKIEQLAQGLSSNPHADEQSACHAEQRRSCVPDPAQRCEGHEPNGTYPLQDVCQVANSEGLMRYREKLPS